MAPAIRSPDKETTVNNSKDVPEPVTQPAVAVRPAPGKKQSTASLFAAERELKLKWKSLIGTAHGVWNKIPTEELARVGGSIPTLAGLVQLRHQLSRQEADTQVKAFFATHFPVQPA